MSHDHGFQAAILGGADHEESTARARLYGGNRRKIAKIELENQPGDIPPPYHFHPGQEEEFTVIKGRLTLEVGGEQLELGPGESILAPRNTRHTFWNASDEPVRRKGALTIAKP